MIIHSSIIIFIHSNIKHHHFYPLKDILKYQPTNKHPFVINQQNQQNWLLVWNMTFIFPYIGNHHLNWRTPIFQRGLVNHQPEKHPQHFDQGPRAGLQSLASPRSSLRRASWSRRRRDPVFSMVPDGWCKVPNLGNVYIMGIYSRYKMMIRWCFMGIWNNLNTYRLKWL